MSQQLRHGKAEKVNSEAATFANATVTGAGIQDTEGAGNTSEVIEVVGGPGEN